MKKLKLIFATTALFIAGVTFILSCSKDKPVVRSSKVTISDTQPIVPIELAKEIAEYVAPNDFKSRNKGLNIGAKPTGSDSDIVRLKYTVENSFTLNDKNGLPALYIFNYANDSGYSIISADLRYQPICAYSDHGNIHENDTIPSMLLNWFEKTVEDIEMLRDGGYDNGNDGYVAWAFEIEANQLQFNMLEFDMRDWLHWNDVNCGPGFNIVTDPLLPCEWGQQCTYNEQCPDKGCYLNYPNCVTNTKAPTGCVPTAMAQIMRYWELPAGYDYSLMPANFGNSEVQRLMKDIGSATGTTYTCDGSSTPSSQIVPAFHQFGYLAVQYYSSYTSTMRWDIKSNIDAKQPILLGGCASETTTHKWIFFTSTSYSQCHVWVADAYRYSGNSCVKNLWFHLNWGWNETNPLMGNYNAYFYFDDWTPGSSNYQYANDAWMNIYPMRQ